MTDQVFFEYQHIHKPSLYADEDTTKFVAKQLANLGDVHKFGRTELSEISDSKSLTRAGKNEVTSSLKTGPFRTRKFGHFTYSEEREEWQDEEVEVHGGTDRLRAAPGADGNAG